MAVSELPRVPVTTVDSDESVPLDFVFTNGVGELEVKEMAAINSVSPDDVFVYGYWDMFGRR